MTIQHPFESGTLGTVRPTTRVPLGISQLIKKWSRHI